MEYIRHFGVYAIIDDAPERRLLVIRKMRGPYTGLYDLPGGTPEPGEQPLETLLREVTEETGCTVTTASVLGSYLTRFVFHRYDEPVIFLHAGIVYHTQVSGRPNQFGDGEDSGGCVWLPLREISQTTCTPFAVLASLCERG